MMITEPANVLLVDDNEDLLDTLSLILKKRGFNVETAEDGASAVAKFKTQHFDVTLMDIVMPRMNGVEAFRRIRQMNPGAKVILMTAYSEDELIKAAINEGAQRVVHKPVKIDLMIELLKEVAMSRLILVIDDDPDLRETMAKTLEREGYQVLAAGSGEEAVIIARERACQIAFVDIKLPRMDGLETFLKLKEINPGITTIMMTGYRDEVRDQLEKAQAASVITCLFKPFDPFEAVDLLSQFGGKRDIRHNNERQSKYTGS